MDYYHTIIFSQRAFQRLFTSSDEEYFFENLSMLIISGIDIGTALDSLEKSVQTRFMKSLIAQMRMDIESGTSLSMAIGRQGILSEQMISLLRIGEQSGRLGENMQLIAGQLEKNKSLKNKISSATLYPVFVFCLTLIVGIGIAWFVLPNLSQVFSRLHITLPLTTKILIFVGNFLKSYGVIAILISMGIIILLGILFATVAPMKMFGQTVLRIIPGVRTVVREIELTRFGFILGTLLRTGLPFPQALRFLEESTEYYTYKRFYRFLTRQIEEGNTLAKSISHYSYNTSYIPLPFQQLIGTAESSGKLADTLVHIGELSEVKIDIVTKNLSVLLEPILLVIVWLGVLWVAVSVILPIYGLIGGLNTATSP